ncbi:MAG TPA: helix-hairpin-helix domain-containing protein [Burkholderiales bacterium]|jgi:competence protein ComEA
MKWFHAAALSLFLAVSAVAQAAPVDINTADAKALASAMTGVGQKRAQMIVDYRTKNGPFKSVDDLTRVKGVGQATVDKNRANLAVGKSTSK